MVVRYADVPSVDDKKAAAAKAAKARLAAARAVAARVASQVAAGRAAAAIAAKARTAAAAAVKAKGQNQVAAAKAAAAIAAKARTAAAAAVKAKGQNQVAAAKAAAAIAAKAKVAQAVLEQRAKVVAAQQAATYVATQQAKAAAAVKVKTTTVAAQVVLAQKAASEEQARRSAAFGGLAARAHDLFAGMDPSLAAKAKSAPIIEDTSIAAENRALRVVQEVGRAGNKPDQFVSALQGLRDEQVRSGGRYVARDSFNSLVAAAAAAAKASEVRVQAEIDHAEVLLAAWRKSGSRADAAAYTAWIARPGWKQAHASYTEWNGSGRVPGKLASVQGMANQISTAHDQYITNQIGPRSMGDIQAAAQAQAAQGEAATALKGALNATSGRGRGAPGLTIQEYLDQLAAADQATASESRQQYDSRVAQAKFEGYDVVDGRFVPAKGSPQDEVLGWITKGLGAGDQIGNYLDDSGRIKGKTSVDQDRNLRALVAAAQAGRRKDLTMMGVPSVGSAGPGAPYVDPKVRATWEARNAAADAQIWKVLTGGPPKDAIWGLGGVPGLGELMKGFQIPIGAVGTGIKLASNALGGRITTPDVQLDAPWSGKDFISYKGADGRPVSVPSIIPGIGFDASGMRKTMNTEEWNRFAQEFYVDAAGDPIKQLEIMAQYGADPIQGSLGAAAFNIFGDPTLALSLTKFLSSGRLAAGRLGGIANAMAKPTEFISDWYRMAMPAKLGGKAGSLVERQVLAGAEKALGRPIVDEAAYVAAGHDLEALRNAPTRQEASALAEKILGKAAPDRETRQLISFVEDMTNKQAVTLGINPLSAVKYHKLGADIEAGLLRSEGEAALSVERVRAIAEQEQMRVALAPTLAAKGVAAPSVPRPAKIIVTAAEKIKVAGEVQLRTITEAKTAFAKAEAITEVARSKERSGLIVEATVKYDAWRVARAKAVGFDSPVREAIARFETFDRGISKGRVFEQIAQDLSEADVRLSKLRMLRAKRAGNAVEFVKWKGAYDAGVKIQRRYRDHAVAVRDLARTKAAEAAQYIPQARVAAKVASAAHADDWFLRELYSRVFSGGRRPAIKSSVPEKIKHGGRVPDDEIVVRTKFAAGQGSVLTVADIPVALSRAYPDLVGGLVGRSLEDVWAGFAYLRSYDDLWGMSRYDDLLDFVWDRLSVNVGVGASARVTAEDAVKAWKRIAAADADSFAVPVGLKVFEQLDAVHASAIATARGGQAQGIVAVGRRKMALGVGGAKLAIHGDTGALEVFARLDAQRGTVLAGAPLEVWDQARSLLGQSNLVRHSSTNVLARAEKIVARTGGDLVETQARLLEGRRIREGGIALRKFASTMVGSSPDEIWVAYQIAQFREPVAGGGRMAVTRFQVKLFDQVFEEMTGHSLPGKRAVPGVTPLPVHDFSVSPMADLPIADATAFREAMVDRGFWSPRDARLIAEGQRSWSVPDERGWLAGHGYEVPKRLDEAVLEKAVRGPDAYDALMRESGVFGDNLDNAVNLRRIEPGKEGQVAMAFGVGTKRARTLDELRRYAAERYRGLVAMVDKKGNLVLDKSGNPTFHDMPWLMTVGEYKRNVGRFVGEGLQPGLVPVDRLPIFVTAVQRAVVHRMDQWVTKGILGRGVEWLPAEREAFALGIVDELLATGSWGKLGTASMFGKASKRLQGLNALGFVQRLNIVTNLAFPMMNLLDSQTVKRLLLAIQHHDWHILPGLGMFDADAIDAVRSLTDVGASRGGVFDLAERGNVAVIRDPEIRWSVKANAAFHLLPNWGFEVSSWAEDRLRLHFARRIYMAERDDLLLRGWTAEAARSGALSGAARDLSRMFPSLENATDFEKALNQISPFFSYNARNKVLGIKLMLMNPYVVSIAGRIGDSIEKSNRETWATQNPGVPFPEDKARQVWVEIDGIRYTIDFSQFSDWFRGPAAVLGSGYSSVSDLLGQFIRPIHPSQAATLALIQNLLDGGKRTTPWGTVADLAAVAWPADLIKSWGGVSDGSVSYFEALTKTLFFTKIGRLTPTDGRVAFWKHLQDLGMSVEAQTYVDEHPDVGTWLELHRSGDYRLKLDGFSASWFGLATPEERAALVSGWDGLSRLQSAWDAKLAPFLERPWDPAYSALKKERSAEIAMWYQTHPEMMPARVWGMNAREWGKQLSDWAVDEDVNSYFALLDTKPKLANFKTKMAYYKALGAFSDVITNWLVANPEVVNRLRGEEGSIRAVWYDQQARWEKIVRDQTRLQIDLLNLEGHDSVTEKAVADGIRTVMDSNYLLLSQEAYAYRASKPDVRGEVVGNSWASRIVAAAGGFMGRMVELPGREDYFYDIASPTEKVVIKTREVYYAKLDKLFAASERKDGTMDWKAFEAFLRADPAFSKQYYAANPKSAKQIAGTAYFNAITAVFKRGGENNFYAELEKNPALMAEYFRRHPEKVAKYRAYKSYGTGTSAGSRYYNAITSLVQRSGKENFYSELEKNPALMAEYFRRHPEKVAKYQAYKSYGTGTSAGSRYYEAITSLAQRSGKENFYSELEKNPALMAEYFRRHPDKVAKYQAYKGYETAASAGSRYIIEMSALYNGTKDGKTFWAGLEANSWLYREYLARHPDKAAEVAAGTRYYNKATAYVDFVSGGDYAGAHSTWNDMTPEQRTRFLSSTSGGVVATVEYSAAMGQWVSLLSQQKTAEARSFFAALPTWVKEKYVSNHPDKATVLLSANDLGRAGDYFLLQTAAEREVYLGHHPELASWMNRFGGVAEARRAAIVAGLAALPKDPWLRRVYQERYPEIFSDAAAVQASLATTARRLAEHPEMTVAFQAFIDRIVRESGRVLGSSLPKPFTLVRQKAVLRRRASRGRSAEWTAAHSRL